ncbi:MAG: hypothetical protein HYV97_05940 [Bdellovibrio sp.]|nr:hypothetical protein [Bdellovibrio sp.]
MKFLLILLVFLFCSCSLKSNTDENSQGVEQGHGDGRHEVLETGLDPNADNDGDFVKNAAELSLGRHPLVADIPELSINFLQNYKITADARSISTGEITKIEIDTRVGRNNPSFKYRVGELFVRGNALRSAASVGRFSSHSSGEIEDHDLSWVKYPDVDPAFYSEQVLKYKKYFDSADFEITNLKITLENTVKLKGNGYFRSIKNLKLNFYYYNYETQNFEIIAAKVVSRHFEAGVVETFEVELDNVPSLLIEDNYFKKGEFIISEVADYEIPELESTYRTLLASVKEKCLPVIVTTPLGTSVSYVGIDGVHARPATFSQILSILYDKNVKIEDDRLSQIGEWRNNLSEFTHLKEVADLDKAGKWFVFTKRLKTTYLDHKFTPIDVIVLTYATGKELASVSLEKIYSFEANLSTSESFTIFPLGVSSQNSLIEFQLKPVKRIGEELGNFQDAWISRGGSCGQNCISRDFVCEISINLFKPIEPKFTLTTETAEFKRMYLIVDHDEYSLEQLMKDKKIEIQNMNGNLHLRIPDIEKIKEVTPGEETNLALKIMAFTNTTFHGVKLNSFTGRDRGYCIPMVVDFSARSGFPLSVESAEFGGWRGGVNWNAVKLGENKTYFQGMEIAVTSVINNYFN